MQNIPADLISFITLLFIGYLFISLRRSGGRSSGGAAAVAEEPKRHGYAKITLPEGEKVTGMAWVIDGDTIKIRQLKIRLAGIDAPELDQPFGQKSKWEMVKICKGQTIHVDLTGDQSYDRLVGVCCLDDGTDIGAELIRRGLALDGGHYAKGKYRHVEPRGERKRVKAHCRMTQRARS